MCIQAEEEADHQFRMIGYNRHNEEIASCAQSMSHTDPKLCHCNGGGWFLSDFDSWHKCSTHNTGQAHPEMACMDWLELDDGVLLCPVDGRPVAPGWQ